MPLLNFNAVDVLLVAGGQMYHLLASCCFRNSAGHQWLCSFRGCLQRMGLSPSFCSQSPQAAYHCKTIVGSYFGLTRARRDRLGLRHSRTLCADLDWFALNLLLFCPLLLLILLSTITIAWNPLAAAAKVGVIVSVTVNY